MPLADTAKKVLSFISNFRKAHDYPPLLSEVAEGIGFTKVTVKYHLNRLKTDGLVTWTPKAKRTLELTAASKAVLDLHGGTGAADKP